MYFFIIGLKRYIEETATTAKIKNSSHTGTPKSEIKNAATEPTARKKKNKPGVTISNAANVIADTNQKYQSISLFPPGV